VSSGGLELREEAYIAAQDEIRRIVPPERLLVFDVRRHGWSDLTQFLGVPAQPVDRAFPHPRSKDSWTNDSVWDLASSEKKMALVGLYVVLHVINYVLIMEGLRALRRLWQRIFAPAARHSKPE